MNSTCPLSSQACAMWAMANFMCGQDVDTPRLQRALELEDYDADVRVPFAPALSTLVLAWTGRWTKPGLAVRRA